MVDDPMIKLLGALEVLVLTLMFDFGPFFCGLVAVIGVLDVTKSEVLDGGIIAGGVQDIDDGRRDG